MAYKYSDETIQKYTKKLLVEKSKAVKSFMRLVAAVTVLAATFVIALIVFVKLRSLA
jgi:hypothetical protein